MAPIRKMLSQSDITEQQWRILRVLEEHGASDASTVADKASLLFPSLTRIAIAMEQRGLITRSPDTSDRRRLVLKIAPEGKQVLEDNLDEALRIVETYKAKLGARDYERLLNLLQKLAD